MLALTFLLFGDFGISGATIVLPHRAVLGRIKGDISVQRSVWVSSFGVCLNSRIGPSPVVAFPPPLLWIENAKANLGLDYFDFSSKLWLEIGVATEIENIMIPRDINSIIVRTWLFASQHCNAHRVDLRLLFDRPSSSRVVYGVTKAKVKLS